MLYCMLSNRFAVIQVDYTGHRNIFTGEKYNNGGKTMYAWVQKFNGWNDLLKILKIYGNVVSVSLCDTRNQAVAQVDELITDYKEKGICL